MENDTATTPFTLEVVMVEKVTVLPVREEPIMVLLFTVEPNRLDVRSVLPRIVEYAMNPP